MHFPEWRLSQTTQLQNLQRLGDPRREIDLLTVVTKLESQLLCCQNGVMPGLRGNKCDVTAVAGIVDKDHPYSSIMSSEFRSKS